MKKGRRPAAYALPHARSNPYEYTEVSCEVCLSTGDSFPWLLAFTFHPLSPQGLWENHIQGFCLAFLLE